MTFEQSEQSSYQPSDQELRSGKISMAGFLKEGQTLKQVLERDEQALRMLGYTAQEVADLLGPVTEGVANGGNFEYTAPNGKQYEVRVQTWLGSQRCPWRDKVDWRRSSGAMDMYFTEKGKGGEPVHIAGLVRHLVEKHGFFEGSSYRVAPETIVEMFGIEKIPGSLEKVKKIKL
ncbi:hypothetical protein ISS42_03220 [Candidatus Shapirobacteria bacterium]|nr:hypothetical protein [Candidatus Shapirobacteria bacterium]